MSGEGSEQGSHSLRKAPPRGSERAHDQSQPTQPRSYCYPAIMVEEDVSTGRNCVSTNISASFLGICLSLISESKLARQRMTACNFDAIPKTWCGLHQWRRREGLSAEHPAARNVVPDWMMSTHELMCPAPLPSQQMLQTRVKIR